MQALQGAALPAVSSQPAALVSSAFPAEDEQHSQPISQQGLHYLHSAYRVGEDRLLEHSKCADTVLCNIFIKIIIIVYFN